MSALIAKAQRAASGSPNQAIGDFTTRDLAALVALYEREVANRFAAESYGRDVISACAHAESDATMLREGVSSLITQCDELRSALDAALSTESALQRTTPELLHFMDCDGLAPCSCDRAVLRPPTPEGGEE